MVYFRDRVTEVVWKAAAGGVGQEADVEEWGARTVDTSVLESEKTQA